MGNVSYSSTSNATNAVTEVNGYQPGFGVQGELWLSSYFGFLAEGGLCNADITARKTFLRGKRITQHYEAVSLGARVAGHGGARNSELVFFYGISLTGFSDAQSYPGANFYDLRRVNTFGARIAPRARIAVTKETLIELGGYYFVPMGAFNLGSGSLSKTSTFTLGGTFAIEKSMSEQMHLGVGYRYEANHLGYTPAGFSKPQSSAFDSSSAFLFVRFCL